ncbi:MAG TPA: hypothetical protein VE621_09305, partial [Bryobacteraceae bacterium]|nr:hypothetical protein [Bryobacteraceae bacterium]
AAAGRRLYGSRDYSTYGPRFNHLRVTSSDATSDYHSLQTQFKRRFAAGLQALASYTWSHSIDSLTNETLVGLEDQRLSEDRASSDTDRRHMFTAAMSWDIPAQPSVALARALLRGWGTDFTFRALSAPPIAIMIWPNSLYGAVRPNLVAGQPIWLHGAEFPGGRRLNPAAFQAPARDTQGNAPRNFVRGFGMSQLDLTVRREFGLTERARLQFRAEAFNALNTPNFADPMGTTYAYSFEPTYGLATQMLNTSLGGLNKLYQSGGPRSLQLGLKLLF